MNLSHISPKYMQNITLKLICFEQGGETPSPGQGNTQVSDGPDGGAAERVAKGEGGGHDI